MPGQCVVALYKSRQDAEQAYRAVLGSGIPQDHVRVSAAQQSAETTGNDGGGIWDWLFGVDAPESDRRLYNDRLATGGTVVSVLVDSPSIASVDQVEGLLDRFNPTEMHDENVGSSAAATNTASRTSAAAQGSRTSENQSEQVIPLPKEELNVGKRATERVQRIRTYVVEEPVQKDVQLRAERTVVERRPATGAPQGTPKEREVEIREIHEEPVVQKSVKAGEELVVRKEATERTERVGGTVKKTEADIDQRKS